MQSLASTNITNDEERNQVATDLAILTSNTASLTEEDVQDSVDVIEAIVSTEKLNQNVSKILSSPLFFHDDDDELIQYYAYQTDCLDIRLRCRKYWKYSNGNCKE